MRNPYDFTGKKFIVTGASSGIGRSTAVRLSEQGAQIVLISRNQEKLEETRSMMQEGFHQIIPVDLGRTEDLSEVFDEIISDGVKLDGFVHCAGIATILPLERIRRKNLEECMNINLYALLELARLYAKKKYRNTGGEGSIVAVSSIVARYPAKCQTVYAASKGAVNAVVQTLAIELAKKGIRINSIMPASTDTAMMRQALENMPNTVMQEKMKDQLLGVMHPDDIADAILFLLSDASRATTGRAFYADGGLLG